jgi:hypothetical protein
VANNYLEFSEVLTHLNPAEETWLRQQMEHVVVFGDQEYLDGEVPKDLDPDVADWSGVRAWRNLDDIEYPDEQGFEHEFDDGSEWDDWGRHLWLYAEESGEPQHVARLVQQFLRHCRPDQCWSLTYSITCSKRRVGEFSGGACFVTADEIKWQDAYRFVEEQRQAFAKTKKRESAHE